MQIVIHRGINQIGGCITEIATSTSRILIDLGQNLPDNTGDISDPLANSEAVERIVKGVDAIFYSHYHGDHVGLMEFVPEGVEQYIGSVAKEVMAVKAKYLRKEECTISILKTFNKLNEITKGNITIIPFLVSHSACDSYMFLIEADGKKVLHTGDFRDHGYIGEGLIPAIKKYIGQVDFLITEGTMLSRSNEKVPTESHLQMMARKLMHKHKYVFVLGSSTDIDRIATFHKANPDGRLFVCDSYQAEVLDVFTHNNGAYSGLYKFDNISVFPDSNLLKNMIDKGFCMMIRCNKNKGKYSKFTDLVIDRIPKSDRMAIYSMWSGYIAEGRNQKTEYIELLSKFDNVGQIHTSGHASQECLIKVCNLTAPRLAIIPIHSENSENFRQLLSYTDINSRIVTASECINGVDIIIRE
ncbi:MBL fold metallo-hydrolase [Bacteroides sedimenti]|uniref:Metallo-beta-lactamase domain-containing protein n=1 Tax=Bacteroides sedimenti TaxID=2136147 RepID=A0ABM8IEW2_9BACE